MISFNLYFVCNLIDSIIPTKQHDCYQKLSFASKSFFFRRFAMVSATAFLFDRTVVTSK